MTVVVVTGSRNWDDEKTIEEAILNVDNPTVVYEGGARGADLLAASVAGRLEIPVRTIGAQWARYGKSAGPIRNIEMLDLALEEAKATSDEIVLLAFPLPDSVGTKHMMKIAAQNNVESTIYN